MVKVNKSLLVIGGTGFIGSHLLKSAKKFGYKLTSISLSKPNKRNYIPGVKYLKIDVTKKNEFKKIKNNFDFIVNAGGYGGLDNNFKNMKAMHDAQYKGLKNIASFFLKKKVKKFIQIGSSLEYGSFSGVNTENLIPKNPITIYGRAKLYSTNYLRFLYKVYNFPIVILRLYQVYGPAQKNRIIPYVINAAFNKKKIYTTKGDQERDFCYIEDVIEAIFKCFNSEKSVGEIINIGFGKGYKIKYILEKILNLFPEYEEKNKIKRIISNNKQTKKLVPSIKKAKKILNWSPKTNLEKGIIETISAFKNE